MGTEITLQNVTVDGDWIEGDIQVDVNELGLSLSKSQHFKTKKDVEQDIDLGSGFALRCIGTLEPPNYACVSGRITKDFVSVDLPKKCVSV
ncbi:hypothetical protein [Rhizobium jaguaris]|uniref:hypothetical protein n=1 Tax=Rhizobium jaguaris TaxID=1312183 RepID=UPI000EAAC025|nr:hypothetical protein [Rhizobium jaguaris]